MSTLLTKTQILSFRQCPRRLWLELHEPLPPAPRSQRMIDGELVNERARAELGTVVWPRSDDDKAAAAANALIELDANSTLPFVEFPVVHQGVYVRLDALIPTSTGYVLRETKSSGFPVEKDDSPGDAEKRHIEDIAIQAWALVGAGVRWSRAELSLINKPFVYPGNGAYQGLLKQLDVTVRVHERLAEVPHWVEGAQAMRTAPMPVVQTGQQCGKPYPCPYIKRCQSWEPPAPDAPLTLLPGSAGKALARKLADQGHVSLTGVTEGALYGKDVALYRRIRKAHIDKSAVLEPAAGEYLRTLPYPRFYFDFESINSAVPLWRGIRPFQQICFQWSCHVEHAPGQFTHAQFLDVTGDDPTERCARSLLAALGDNPLSPIFVFYAQFEDGRLKEMAEMLPALREALFSVRARLIDLLPITKQSYYHPAMVDSFSIKAVLPTISALNYEELVEVKDGETAQMAYMDAALKDAPAERVEDLARKLRQYCRQDTWAMVLLAYYLAGDAAPIDTAESRIY